MLTLLLTGEIPAEGPAQELDASPLARTTDDGIITPGTLMRLRRMFTRPLINTKAVRRSARVWSGPHLVNDENSANVYYFDVAPGPAQNALSLTLPQTLTVPPSGDRARQETPSGWGGGGADCARPGGADRVPDMTGELKAKGRMARSEGAELAMG
ncbi:hypothetical protein [Streptomyces sp. NPDC101132]|uniref:hypothetical protein n=1 Tax=Streptomyces sp. NPDC101132 TaxID=3366110 RepID=UPI00380A141E